MPLFTCDFLMGIIDWDFNLLKNIYLHDTRTCDRQKFHKATSSHSWGQHRFSYHIENEWNNLPIDTKNCADLLSFKCLINNIVVRRSDVKICCCIIRGRHKYVVFLFFIFILLLVLLPSFIFYFLSISLLIFTVYFRFK